MSESVGFLCEIVNHPHLFEEAVNDTTLKNLSYADGTMINANSAEVPRRSLKQLPAVGNRSGLKMNTTETKVHFI